MNENQITELIKTAADMRNRSRAPYSGYTVGAALLTATGEIIGGCNVESASYGLTCCAERTAIYRALAEGHASFTALAVATRDGGSPCGACRQVIWEQCGDIPVFIVDESGAARTSSSGALLPDAFGSENLR